jgi:Putative stress-responsive transcriptional regulator
MNEINRIHIAGVSYEIDVTAKKSLEKYLTAIHKSLGDEIDAMEDIEIRMTEILATRGVTKDRVITEYDLKAVKEQLGEPDDFASDANSKTGEGRRDNQSSHSRDDRFSASKKYYRNSDDAVIGGVLAGLANYTGWDVTIIRLVAVILGFMSLGTVIILYFITWMVAPEAVTASEKLEMRGEPVNIGSLKESAKEFGDKAKEAGKNIDAKANRVAKEVRVKTSGLASIIGRITAVFFGAVGLITIFGMIVGTILAGNEIIYAVVSADITAKPLLIVAVSLTIAFLVALTIFIAVISVALLTNTYKKGFKLGLIISLILSMVLLAGASGTMVAWYSVADKSEIRQIIDDASDEHGNWCIGICK